MKAKLIFVTLILATASMIFADDTKPGPFTDQDYHGYIITNAGKIFAGTGTFAVITADQTIYTASGTNIDMNGFLILNLGEANTASGAVNLAQVKALTNAIHTALLNVFLPLSGGEITGPVVMDNSKCDLVLGSVTLGNDISNCQAITIIIPAAGNVVGISADPYENLVLTNHASTGYMRVFVGTPTYPDNATTKAYVDGYAVPKTGGSYSGNVYVTGDVSMVVTATENLKLTNDGGDPALVANNSGASGTLYYDAIEWKFNTAVSGSTPTETDHFTTKTYVDTADALKLSLAGGTMEGDLIMGSAVVGSSDIQMYGGDVLNTYQITGNAGGDLKLVAHTASGRALDVMGNDGSDTKIEHVDTPTADTDAANKKYVDDADDAVFADVTNGFELGETKTIMLDTNGSTLGSTYSGGVNLLAYNGYTLNIDGTYPIVYHIDQKADMAGFMITNITTSTEQNGVVTKAYVDGATNQYSAVSWSVSTPNTGAVSAVTIQLKNSSGSNLSGYYMLDMWTSTNTYGLPVDYSDTNVYSVGTLLKENTANAHWTLQSSSTGTVSVTFKRNTDGVLHVMYTSPVLKGKIYATSKTWLAP